MQPHEQQQRIDELSKKMEAMQLELQKLQELRKMQGKTNNSSEVVGGSQNVVANVNKWMCNPLVEAAVNYALTTSKQVIDMPIVAKSSTFKDQLTSFVQKFDTKLKIVSPDQPLIINTISDKKSGSAGAQVCEASSTINEKVQQTTHLSKDTSTIDQVNPSQSKAANMTMGDALSYVNNIKQTLLNDNKNEIYREFLDVLSNYKTGKCNIPNVEEKVKQLFKDYPQFIIGFQQFSLTGQQTEKKDQQLSKTTNDKKETGFKQTHSLKVQDALSYLDQVKYTFSDKPQVYNEFLDILKDFKAQAIDTPGVMKKVTLLFEGHPHMIVGFNTFLPSGYRIDVDCNDVGFVMPSRAKPVKMTVKARTAKEDLKNKQKNTTEASIDTEVSSQPQETKSVDYSQVNGYSSKQKNTTEASIDTEVSSLPQENKSVDYSQVNGYVEKVLKRFKNEPKKFNSFLKIIQTFKKRSDELCNGSGNDDTVLAQVELLQEIAELFVNNEDLLKEFVQNMHH